MGSRRGGQPPAVPGAFTPDDAAVRDGCRRPAPPASNRPGGAHWLPTPGRRSREPAAPGHPHQAVAPARASRDGTSRHRPQVHRGGGGDPANRPDTQTFVLRERPDGQPELPCEYPDALAELAKELL